MNKKTILNIQEIASLKSGMKTLEEIRKTHDGTSMGKVGPALDEWAEKNRENRWAISLVGIIDKNGKTIGYRIGDAIESINSIRPSVTDGVEDELKDSWKTPSQFSEKTGYKDFHLIETSGRGGNEGEYTRGVNIKESGAVFMGELAGSNVPKNEHPYANEGTAGTMTVPNPYNMNKLLEKNKDGEYLVRSYSMVGNNGTRISIIRNNKFNQQNEGPYDSLANSLNKATIKYESDYQQRYREIAQNIIDNHEYPDNIKGHKLLRPYDIRGYVEHKAQQQALKEMGTWEQAVLKGQGFDKQFEEQNVKIRVSRKKTDNRSRYSSYDESSFKDMDNTTELYEKTGGWGQDSPWRSNNKKVQEERYDWSKAGYTWAWTGTSYNWIHKDTPAYDDYMREWELAHGL